MLDDLHADKTDTSKEGKFPKSEMKTLISHQKAHLENILLLFFKEMSFTFCLSHLFTRQDFSKTRRFSKASPVKLQIGVGFFCWVTSSNSDIINI